MSDLVSWVWFSRLRGLTVISRRRLLENIGSPADIIRSNETALKECGLTQPEIDALSDHDTQEAQNIIARCQEKNVTIITMQDAQYPERLKNIPDPPAVLYVIGKLPAMDVEAAVAVVGTRRSTPYGDNAAKKIGYGIAKHGGLVVTGLAQGNDSMAAKGALMAGGKVVGVLGTAIDEVFPRFNKPLFDDVAMCGALVSEYPPGEKGNKGYFPQRNRIMAGLTLGTVVIEAPRGSGALITARRALEYGRDVFAVPGNMDASNSRGSNELLREGAQVCLGAEDIMEEYAALYPDKIDLRVDNRVPEELHTPELTSQSEEKQEKVKPAKKFFRIRIKQEPLKKTEESKLEDQLGNLSETQLKIVSAMSQPSMHVDDIIAGCGLPTSSVLTELTLLQIKGYVTQESGKRFTLKIAKRG